MSVLYACAFLFHDIRTYWRSLLFLHLFCLNKIPALIITFVSHPWVTSDPHGQQEKQGISGLCSKLLQALAFSPGPIVNICPISTPSRGLWAQSTEISKLSCRIFLYAECFHGGLEPGSLYKGFFCIFFLYLVFYFPEMFGSYFYLTGILSEITFSERLQQWLHSKFPYTWNQWPFVLK